MKSNYIFFIFLTLLATISKPMRKDYSGSKKYSVNNTLEFNLNNIMNNTNKDIIIEELPPHDTNYLATYGTKIEEVSKNSKKVLNKKLNLEPMTQNLVSLLKIYDENDISQALLVKIIYLPQSKKITTELTSLNNKNKEHVKTETIGLPVIKNGSNKILLKLTIEGDDFKQSKIEVVS